MIVHNYFKILTLRFRSWSSRCNLAFGDEPRRRGSPLKAEVTHFNTSLLQQTNYTEIMKDVFSSQILNHAFYVGKVKLRIKSSLLIETFVAVPV
jgi:hypothetical protein